MSSVARVVTAASRASRRDRLRAIISGDGGGGEEGEEDKGEEDKEQDGGASQQHWSGDGWHKSGGGAALQHLVGNSHIMVRGTDGVRQVLEHGGIYCEAMITLDEQLRPLPPGKTRKAHFIAHCGVIDILQSFKFRKQVRRRQHGVAAA